MKKILVISCLVALFALFSLSTVAAITASIGNSRMILRASVGEEIERSILVRNTNDYPVDIVLTPLGDLAENIKLVEDSFSLEIGEEKKAYFTIMSSEEGRTESKIDVRFQESGGSGGVGLSSTIILFASINTEGGSPEEINAEGNGLENQGSNDNVFNLPKETFLYITTPILLILLVLLVFYSSKKRMKKRVRGSSD